jgi:hypothetical protein
MLFEKLHPRFEKLAAPAYALALQKQGLAQYTYLPTVSESPTTHKCLLGRVIATAQPLSVLFHARCRAGGGGTVAWLVLPFNLRFSPRNPTSWSALLRTKLTMTASFSRP